MVFFNRRRIDRRPSRKVRKDLGDDPRSFLNTSIRWRSSDASVKIALVATRDLKAERALQRVRPPGLYAGAKENASIENARRFVAGVMGPP
jgi:hypothetical protein